MNWAVLVAAGQGVRMGTQENKVFLPLGGRSILARSLAALLRSPHVAGAVVVHRAEDEARVQALCGAVPTAKPVHFALGGESRRASVANGLAQLPPDCDFVLVHDAARPLVSQSVIEAAVLGAKRWGCAAPGIPVIDTIKRVDEHRRVIETPDRASLLAVQTPQVFVLTLLRRAHAWGAEHMQEATDDTLLVEGLGERVYLTAGETSNLKVTTPEDLLLAEALLGESEGSRMMRVGTGYDVHRLVPDRKLILLGEEIPYEKGLLGHSDADVAAHALSDALLGAAGLGDIGRHFPDTDETYRGADSMALLKAVVEKLRQAGYAPHNADVTIICQRPKLAPYLPAMGARTADILGLSMDFVNVKATTTEGLGFEGEGLGISAQAAVSIRAL